METAFLIDEILKELKWDINHLKIRSQENKSINGLKVKRMGDIIEIEYSEPVFLARALGIAYENKDRDFVIEEKSNFKMDGVMIDCSRGAVMKVSKIQEMLRKFALMGLDTLFLYTEDTYEITDEPYFGYMRGRYTIEELQEIDSYADKLGIEAIPCIQTLGHLYQVLRWEPYKNIRQDLSSLSVKAEESYIFIEKAIAACRKVFHSKRIHIGMDESGVSDVEIFSKHLYKVKDICEKYDFKPMFWGDMPFRISGVKGYTDCNDDIDFEKISEFNFKGIDIIYWDYYNTNLERIDSMIRAHKLLSDKVLFFGGAWNWIHFAPNLTHAALSSKNILKKCLEHNIDEVALTLWGDDGTECGMDAVLPIIQLYGEYRFDPNITEKRLSERFKTCTGGIYEDFKLLELPAMPMGVRDGKEDNPDKYLLYQDPLMGIFDFHVKEGFDKYYKELADDIDRCAVKNSGYTTLFTTMAALCRVLDGKSELGLRLKKAYDNNDFPQLKIISELEIPIIIAKIQIFQKELRKQWMESNKPFGYSLHEKRLGGLIARLQGVCITLDEYINGKSESILELEEKRLPYNGHSDKNTVYAFHPNPIDAP